MWRGNSNNPRQDGASSVGTSFRRRRRRDVVVILSRKKMTMSNLLCATPCPSSPPLMGVMDFSLLGGRSVVVQQKYDYDEVIIWIDIA